MDYWRQIHCLISLLHSPFQCRLHASGLSDQWRPSHLQTANRTHYLAQTVPVCWKIKALKTMMTKWWNDDKQLNVTALFKDKDNGWAILHSWNSSLTHSLSPTSVLLQFINLLLLVRITTSSLYKCNLLCRPLHPSPKLQYHLCLWKPKNADKFAWEK